MPAKSFNSNNSESPTEELLSNGQSQFNFARWLILLALSLCMATAAQADTLEDWRNAVTAARHLAENDAQQACSEAQRLLDALPENSTPFDQTRILNALARAETYAARVDSAAKHAQQALNIATPRKDRIGQAEAQLNITLNAINQARVDASMAAAVRSVQLLEGVDRPDLLGEAMLRMAMMYRRLGDFDNSVTMAMQAMEIAKRSNDPYALTFAHQGMGISFEQSSRNKEALEHYRQMREHARAAGSKMFEAHAIQGMATQMMFLGDVAESEKLLRKTIDMFRALHTPFSLNFSLSGLANNLHKQGRHTEAVTLLDEVIANYGKYPNRIGLWFALNARSQYLQNLGRIKAARADAELAYALAKEIGVPVYLGGSARRMSEIAAAEGDFSRAYALAVEAEKMASKSTLDNASARIVELTRRYETESKQRKIDELTLHAEQQDTQQRWLWTVLAGTSILLALTAFFIIRLRRSREEIRILNAGLEQRVQERTAELQQNRHSLADAQRIAHVGSWELDHASNTLTWSDECHLIFEIELPIFGGTYEAFLDTLHPEDRDMVHRAFQASLEDREPYEIEHRLSLPDGRIKYVHERCETVYGEDGKPLRSIGTVQDITVRKEMENALHEGRQLLSEAQRIAQVGSWEYDIASDTHTWSDELFHIYEIDPGTEEASYDGCMYATHPDDREAIARLYLDAVETGQPYESEHRLLMKDGRIKYVHERCEMVCAPNGTLQRAVGMMQDITGRKRMEEALVARERELRALAESSPGMMGSFYLKSNGTVCMPYVSPNIYDLFGLHPQDIAEDASPLMKLNHPDDAQRVMDSIAESARTMTTWHSEYRILHPTKGERWMESNTSPQLHPNGGTIWYGYVHDITERKLVERKLKEALDFTGGIINAIPDILFELNRDGRYLNVWTQNSQLLAAQKEHLLGKTVHDVLSPEAADAAMEAIREADEKGYAQGKDISIDLPQGRHWFSHTLSKKIGGETGEPTFLALSRDITERKEAERKLKEALEFSEGIINAIPDLLFEMDGEGRYLNIWTHTPELLAAQKEILLDNNVAEMLAPEAAATVMEALREAGEKGVSFGKVIALDLPGGTSWFELSVSKKAGGTFLMLSRDITERKRLEVELQDSRNFLDRVIDALPDPVFVKDREHRWILLNDANCKFTGLPREALLGKSDYDIFPKAEAEVFWKKDELVFDSGEVNLNEESFTSANGEEYYIQTKKTPFVSSDGSQMLVGVIRDITDRKQYEAAREMALAEAVRLAKQRSEFLSHMSHELRTPLNGILGYAQILQRDRTLGERNADALNVIRQSGEHLLSLVDDILDLARIDAGRFQLDSGDISLDTFLHVVCDIVRIRAKAKGIGFDCELASELPAGVCCDEKRLRQVLLNLLSNAVKFTERGGVVLRVGKAGSSRLVFEVEDTGVGIAASEFEAIFQPFEQSGEANAHLGGTGLGLSISRQLVRLMGGDIEVESRMGEGSTFRFELELPEVDLAAPFIHIDSAPGGYAPFVDGEPSEPLVVPPQEAIRELHRLALLGNMRDIVQYADRIDGLDPSYRPFADHLKRLADGYQSKAILAFVEKNLI